MDALKKSDQGVALSTNEKDHEHVNQPKTDQNVNAGAIANMGNGNNDGVGDPPIDPAIMAPFDMLAGDNGDAIPNPANNQPFGVQLGFENAIPAGNMSNNAAASPGNNMAFDFEGVDNLGFGFDFNVNNYQPALAPFGADLFIPTFHDTAQNWRPIHMMSDIWQAAPGPGTFRCTKCQHIIRLEDNHAGACRYHPTDKTAMMSNTYYGPPINNHTGINVISEHYLCCNGKKSESTGCMGDYHTRPHM
ncbi:hypothetical protein F5Y16DRAFT_395076 [Xylariaceae sp. FL0255]|nr:hypothetical protein F5Y16DRAFT_395076 [Xylariaceae sp. FL0255]